MTSQVETQLIGQSILRREDVPLLRGAGRYLADIPLPNALHVAILRSPHAHARIVSIDTREARQSEGVHAVYTAADLPSWSRPLPVLWKVLGQKPSGVPALATEKVRYVGEPVAAVVADSRYLAEDALDLIQAEYEILEPILSVEQAAEPDAPIINEEWGENLAAQFTYQGGNVDDAFQTAEVVIQAHFEINRYSGVPLECRGVIAHWDALTESLSVWSGSQDPHIWRTQLAGCLDLPEHAIRMLTPNIGGAFGTKWDPYPEDLLVCILSRELGRPIRWLEDRREHFQATVHARQQSQGWEMALRTDGTILGLRGTITCDLGAHLHMPGIGPTLFTGGTMTGQYKIPNYQADITCLVTNKTPNSTYRGFGMPEATFACERLMDKAARRLDIDPAEIRLRNMVQPEDFPFQNAAGLVYDSGNYPAALTKALEVINYPAFRQEQQRLRERGIYRGLGISCYLEGSGVGPSSVMVFFGYDGLSGYEGMTVKIDPAGKVTLFTGMIPMGQGTETTLAQVAASRFGIPMEDIRVVWGDTTNTPYSGFGSAGSRSNVAAAATIKAVEQLKSKMAQIAAQMMEAAPEDIVFANGKLSVRGVEDRFVTMPDVAREAYLAYRLPAGVQPTLEATYVYDPPDFTWTYGCHVAVLDVDIETGQISWVRYVAVDDCGNIINPMLVEGQVHGGVTQGIGGAIMEEFIYGSDGQLLTTSFMDYLLPSFHDVPAYEVHHIVTPAPKSEGGFKGAGESGCLPPAAAVVNAVVDALSPFGVEIDRTPVTPNMVWQHIAEARASEM